jgi:anaerobic selenocysteine-containing dehydrogenase
LKVRVPANTLSRYTEDDAAPKVEATEVKQEQAAPAEVKEEEPVRVEEQNGEVDVQAYVGDQDMDDEIDFNLGNGTSYDSPSTHEAHGPGIKEDG